MAKAQLTEGMVIDGFLLEERIHRGGMAAIWRVTRPDIAIPIVMKVPFLDYEGDLSQLVGFEVEQMIMAELSGPHVPKVVAVGDFTAQPYIVMERLAGDTLQKRIAAGKLDAVEAVRIATAIADALCDIHGQGVLHLDLKPANVLFRPDGQAVLIDFGLSRHERLPDLLEEQFHKPAGTTEYMAPEQLLRIRSDKRSDLYAVGAILYHMLTGEPPFGTPGRMKDVRRRVWRDPIPPTALCPQVSPALQEVILKCMEPVPDRRHTRAAELAFDLRHLDLVETTERAVRTARADFLTTFRRRLRAGATMREIAKSAAKPPPRAPIILVAIDIRPGLEELQHTLQEAALSVLANTPGGRLACLNVMQTSLIALEENVDAHGENVHLQRLAALRRWTEPLRLPRGKATFHLIEDRSIAAGILDFARSNAVDHIVMGAFNNSLARKVTAEAPCSVSVVRVKHLTVPEEAEEAR